MKHKRALGAAIAGIAACLILMACVAQEGESSGRRTEDRTPVHYSWSEYDSFEEAIAGLEVLSEQTTPEIIVLADGTEVQRVPAGQYSLAQGNILDYNYNTMYLHADERGCASCHVEGLNQVLLDMAIPHFDLSAGLGIDIQVTQCRQCHVFDGFDAPYDHLGTLIHGIHSGSTFTGNCMSCHSATTDGQGMVLWDEVKYDVMENIILDSEAQVILAYDQDTLTGQAPVYWWMSFGTAQSTVNGFEAYVNALEGKPLDMDLLDNWEITISGLVDHPCSVRLGDIINDPDAPIETRIVGGQCFINPANGGLLSNIEITGVPLSWVIEKYGLGVQEGTTTIFAYGGDCVVVQRALLSDVESGDVFLVWRQNGEYLSWEDGFPVMLWNIKGTELGSNVRWVSEITFDSTPLEELYFNTSGLPNKEGIVEDKPNVAIMHLHEGQMIELGKPYTFDGYADGWDEQIVAVEFSLDRGMTWQTLDTSDSDPYAWVHWTLTYTPQMPGSYTLTVRAVSESGMVSPLPHEMLFTVR